MRETPTGRKYVDIFTVQATQDGLKLYLEERRGKIVPIGEAGLILAFLGV